MPHAAGGKRLCCPPPANQISSLYYYGYRDGMAMAWNVIVSLRKVWEVQLLNAMEHGLIIATAKTRSQAVAIG